MPSGGASRRGGSGRALALVVVLAVGAGTLASCGSDKEGVTIPAASGTGRMTIGVSIDEPGVGLKSGTTYSGFDIDTARYVAAKLGVPQQNITFKEAKPADRERMLENGDVDMVVSTYSMTPERATLVTFAGPYYVAHQDLLVRRNDETITGPETLDRKTLCSVTGTTSAAYVKKRYAGKITLKQVPRFSTCVNDLVAGTVDAVTTDDLILAGFAAQEQYKGILRLVGKGFTDERYGIGLKKGSDQVDAVDKALTSYIDSGSWKNSLDANVGDSGFSIPGPPKVGSR